MLLTNKTKYIVDWATGYQKDGRETLTIIIKGTYSLDAEPKLLNEQRPLVEADISTGEPGFSATLYETDYSTFKPYCDVLLNGCAYAPNGEPVTKVDVALDVGSMSKRFVVKGNRTWSEPSPEPFLKMPITYDRAFGGCDTSDSRKFRFYEANPVGTGYSYHQNNLDDMPLPNTEERSAPITNPKGSYTPMSFGPIGRSWSQRSVYAGTYDKDWMENKMPFWPDDFDWQFFQCAPKDQQLPYLIGGEQVRLVNLTPEGRIDFALPKQAVPVTFLQHGRDAVQLDAVVDTLMIEPELGIFTMTSRVLFPLPKSIFDIKEIVIGNMGRAWHHAQRSPTKKYYGNLQELIEKGK